MFASRKALYKSADVLNHVFSISALPTVYLRHLSQKHSGYLLGKLPGFRVYFQVLGHQALSGKEFREQFRTEGKGGRHF